MATTRLYSNGALLLSGEFDEVTQDTISLTSNTYFSNEFDEVTGTPVVDSNLILWYDAGQSQSYSGSGTTWSSVVGTNNGTLQASPTFTSENPSRFTFVAASSQYVSTTTQYANPQSFTIGAIFKTTTTDAKKIIGFENTQTGTGATSWDRHLYVHTDGYLKFGVWRSGQYLANTTYSVADGAWRYAAGTFSNNIATLYVNGQFVANVNAGGSIESYNGWWKIGAYKTWTGSHGYFDGDIAIVHVYDKALTASEVQYNFNAFRRRFNI